KQPKHSEMKTIPHTIFRSFFVKAASACMTSLAISTACIANDGKPASVPAKAAVPLTYYEGFMITVAVVYGICLLVRSYRRKRSNENITE
ncbi:MAG TPA: hypothetical protein VF145_12300, partial [Chitinophagaceae bacterium]